MIIWTTLHTVHSYHQAILHGKMLSISIHWNCGHFTEADLVQLLSPIREADVLGSTGLMLWSYLEEHLEKPRPLRVCLQLPEWMIDFYLGRVFLWSSFGILDFVHFCSSKVAIRVRRAIWSWHCKTVRRLRAVPPPSCHVWTCDFVSCGGKTTPDDAMPRVLRLGVEVLLLLIVTGQLSCLVLLHSVQVSVWICLFLQCWIGILQLSIKIYDSWVCHFFSESWVEAFSVSHVARCCCHPPSHRCQLASGSEGVTLSCGLHMRVNVNGECLTNPARFQGQGTWEHWVFAMVVDLWTWGISRIRSRFPWNLRYGQKVSASARLCCFEVLSQHQVSTAVFGILLRPHHKTWCSCAWLWKQQSSESGKWHHHSHHHT